MMSLENPSISWIDLAKGHGVEAAQAAYDGAFRRAPETVISTQGAISY
jgi:hypothetical protein